MSKTNLKDKLQGDTLDLSMSEIEEVPVKDIAKIRQACSLDLSNNKLVSLPKTFPTLTHIIKLDLSKNMLEELPENFGEMRQLRHLDLYSNQISRLPLSLGELKNLKWLDLKENPLTPAVASIAGLCSNAKECQLCARNVVSYLTNVKSSIEDEKQRRLNAVSSAEASKDANTVKKDSKKKKKRAEAKDIKTKGDKDIVTAVKLGVPKINGVPSATRLKSEITNSTSVTNHRKDGVTHKLCRILFIILFSLIVLSFIAMIGIVTLLLFDPKGANAISTYLEVLTGLPITQYQQLGTQYLEKLVENVTLWTDEFRIVLTEMYAKYFTSTVSRSDL